MKNSKDDTPHHLVAGLQNDIQEAYLKSGNTLGWRFLYSPAQTLNEAKVAFIGLNPGGSKVDAKHSQFAMPNGSAYRDESWAGCAPGQSKLQLQVLALFDRLNVTPDDVLAGNLVPFRSADWASIADPNGSLQFGTALWSQVFTKAKPSIVVTMGSKATHEVAKILKVKSLAPHSVEWGQIKAHRGEYDGGTLIGLPHLSRFSIMTRATSAPCLNELFSGI